MVRFLLIFYGIKKADRNHKGISNTVWLKIFYQCFADEFVCVLSYSDHIVLTSRRKLSLALYDKACLIASSLDKTKRLVSATLRTDCGINAVTVSDLPHRHANDVRSNKFHSSREMKISDGSLLTPSGVLGQ